ncbi:MAG: hypothetical protein WD341_14870 [Tistlia sp.]|uniref:hypothetical protein n=1 Tax=Tistlia sp. TaxID=3057121 RepID=UPI0034A43E72
MEAVQAVLRVHRKDAGSGLHDRLSWGWGWFFSGVGGVKPTFLMLVGCLILGACAQPRISLTYVPQNTQELEGALTVDDFGYFPPEGVAQDEIEEAALGSLHLTEPVGRFVAVAVAQELRVAGVKLRGDCRLTGEVNRFRLNSLGFSSDYMTDIRYILYGSDGTALLDSTYGTKFNASKFVPAEVIIANLNKLVSDNIGQLLRDPGFRQGLEDECPVT